MSSTIYSFGEMTIDYIRWHYLRGFRELIYLCRNFLQFIVHLFSIPLLLKTLFHPWRRMGEAYKKGLDPEAIISALIVNMIMRAVGFISRLAIISVGLLGLLFVLIGSALAIVAWLFLPLILVVLLSVSITLILNSII